MEEFVGTAWWGGNTCGIKISAADRDKYLKYEWGSVDLFIPDELKAIPVNIKKASMWTGNCRELIHIKIKDWFKRSGKFPWPKGRPPRVRLIQAGPRSFALSFV